MRQRAGGDPAVLPQSSAAAFYRHHAGEQASAKGEEMTIDLYLEPKTQLLVAIGAAVAAKCQKCFVTLYGTANKVGATDKEIGAAVAIATKVSVKSDDFMATFIEETTKGKVPAAERTGAAASPGCCS
jgi:alkylhydroperoxidase/carboxymuconolactone decarboxylase family protein YurZ